MAVFAIGFTLVCLIYSGVFYYLLVQGSSENNNGMIALAGFFGIFLFLGLGGIECIVFIFKKRD